MVAAALLGALIAVVFLYTKPSLSEPKQQEPPSTDWLEGRTSDGGRIEIQLSGDWYRWRIDWPATSECAATWMHGGTDWQQAAPDGTFVQNGRYRAGEEVRFTFRGRIRAEDVTGSYVRRDACVRRGTFTAKASRHW